MAQSRSVSGPPIFILSQARTGSTLLRYIIDTHPEVCCPPELAIGRLCRALAYTIDLTTPGSRAPGDSPVHRAVRAHVDTIMQRYCDDKARTRWCDKSTNNLEHLDVLREVFPDAQYVCLHRQCLDVVQSAMELFRFGFPGRYGAAVARSPERLVDALIDSWTQPTRALLEFESAHQSQCVRLTYEDLVATPVATVERMCAFLGLPFTPRLLDEVFTRGHDAGPGDFKIQFTSSILRTRVGKGALIPRNQISDDRLAQIAELHAMLGYDAVTGEREPALERRSPAVPAPARSRRPSGVRWG